MASRRRRRLFTAAETTEIWDRWRRGEGLKLIGRMFGRTSSAMFAHLKPHGGIRPAARRLLSLAEREEISRGIAAGVSLRVRRAAHEPRKLRPGRPLTGTVSRGIFPPSEILGDA